MKPRIGRAHRIDPRRLQRRFRAFDRNGDGREIDVFHHRDDRTPVAAGSGGSR
ncbi:hypothetical protein [Amycolatopsis sp. NPDC051128]|uniref:hypothetical protein n=1 Tax=Amycolatopsis sp. NPDC051128 TaxID=3155412 RepID=UPI0034461834